MHQLVGKNEDKYSLALYHAKMAQATRQERCACGGVFLRRDGIAVVEGLDLHHVVYRESRAKKESAKIQLLDPRNCRLAHHRCHMQEGWAFQVQNMTMLLAEFSLQGLTTFYRTLDIPDRSLPHHAIYAFNLWNETFKRLVPAEEARSKVEWVQDPNGHLYATFTYGGERYDPREGAWFSFGMERN